VAVERRGPPAGRPLRGGPPVPIPPRPTPPRAAVRPAPRAVAGPALAPLVLWPALLSLGVTLLRLAGEIFGWSSFYFSRLPGGGLSPIGITWLAPLVGFYLGWRLHRAGVPVPPLRRAIGLPAAALAVGPLLAWLAGRLFRTSWTANFSLWAVAAVAVAAVAFAAWPALGRPLLAYAYAARVPVAAVMAIAIGLRWGTHYDLPPPGFPPMRGLRLWFWIGFLPQMTIWTAWTMATGALSGALGAQAARRRL